jgi:hypothetical protein
MVCRVNAVRPLNTMYKSLFAQKGLPLKHL